MTLYKWSRTAELDANADPSINWMEGQSPASVNDSARAMMAAMAKYRDDVAGAIVTSGTSTAYAVSSNQMFGTLTDLHRQMIAFVPHLTNGATVTLNVDGLGARPLRSAPSTDLLAGVLIAGTPYTCTYNNSDGAFYLRGFHVSPYSVPLGGGLPYFGSIAPNSAFAFPYGQAISRTTYQSLFSVIGTTYGSGDGSTFNLPDLRGRVLAGKDDMGGSLAFRLTAVGSGVDGAVLGAAGGAQNGTILQANLPNVTLVTTITDPGHDHSIDVGSSGGGSTQVTQGAPGIGSTITGPVNFATTGITASTALGGSGAAFKIVQPAIVCNYIMRII